MTSFTNHTLIELHVPDFDQAKRFYGKLGFQLVWEEGVPEADSGYLVLKRENCLLAFWSGTQAVYKQEYFQQFNHETKRGYAVEIVIMVSDLDSVYAQARASAKVVGALQLRPWGLRDFRVEDPFGYYLRFTEAYDILSNNTTRPNASSDR